MPYLLGRCKQWQGSDHCLVDPALTMHIGMSPRPFPFSRQQIDQRPMQVWSVLRRPSSSPWKDGVGPGTKGASTSKKVFYIDGKRHSQRDEKTARQDRKRLHHSRQTDRSETLKIRKPKEDLPLHSGQKDGTLTLLAAGEKKPRRDKWLAGGDDAFFINSEVSAVGIADGVGSWAKRGVYPGLYSGDLMRNAEAAAKRLGGKCDPVAIMSEAQASTKVLGSCTAAMVTLSGNSLHAANLGDAGYVVVRGGRVIVRSQPQLHGANNPYQLGDSELLACHGSRADSAREARRATMRIKAGDLVVLGTDGLFDNLDNSQVEELLRKSPGMEVTDAVATAGMTSEMHCTHTNAVLGLAAGNLVKSAFRRSIRPGGHRDDISCVVAMVALDKRRQQLQRDYRGGAALALLAVMAPALAAGEAGPWLSADLLLTRAGELWAQALAASEAGSWPSSDLLVSKGSELWAQAVAAMEAGPLPSSDLLVSKGSELWARALAASEAGRWPSSDSVLSKGGELWAQAMALYATLGSEAWGENLQVLLDQRLSLEQLL